MPDTKGSALSALTGANSATGDLFFVVDVSDTTMAASGTTKSMTRAESAQAIQAAYVLAGLNIGTGALTAGTGSFSGILSTTDATEATSTTAASLKTAGGLGVAKKLYAQEGNFIGTNSGDINLRRVGNVAATSEPSHIYTIAPNASGVPIIWSQTKTYVNDGTSTTEDASVITGVQKAGTLTDITTVSGDGLAVTGTLSATTTINTGGYTVATLPAGVTGARCYVTDATGPTYAAALTGGGAVVVPVFYNGAAWVSA